jgi:hypothetical protein
MGKGADDMSEKIFGRNYHIENGQGRTDEGIQLDTLISGSQDKEIVERAVDSFQKGFLQFIYPQEIARTHLKDLLKIREIVIRRIESVSPLITDILITINKRAAIIDSPEYRELITIEAQQWRSTEEPHLEHGVRACVDAGIPREAVAGSEGHMGRSLAGDDELDFVVAKGRFSLSASTFTKRLRHNARKGVRTMLEIFVEHTGCGRRGQMIANLGTEHAHEHEDNVSRLYSLVLDKNNIQALVPEFSESPVKVTRALDQIQAAWEKGGMTKDGGTWAGMMVKVAQRQAYRNIGQGMTAVVPIELYDKMNGNVLVGLDTISAFTHTEVLHEGGYTASALETLVQEGLVFSLKHEVEKIHALLSAEISVHQGENTFEDLQADWLNVKTKFVSVTETLWRLSYDKNSEAGEALRVMVQKFLALSTANIGADLEKVDAEKGSNGAGSELMMRRLAHQLFRALAYAWVLDTFNRGNPPGKHMEDHLATGESAVLGVKEHLPLGQGDMQPPTVSEMITGYSVLMHSTPGEEGRPVVVVMKHDTYQADENALTTEETQRAMDDFAELLKLWPYVMVGDIVPVIAVRDKNHGGVSRLGLSVILAFGDIVDLAARKGRLADLVPASNSLGKVVQIPASLVLQAGVEAGADLKLFRKTVQQIANQYSDEVTQFHFKK